MVIIVFFLGELVVIINWLFFVIIVGVILDKGVFFGVIVFVLFFIKLYKFCVLGVAVKLFILLFNNIFVLVIIILVLKLLLIVYVILIIFCFLFIIVKWVVLGDFKILFLRIFGDIGCILVECLIFVRLIFWCCCWV